MWRSNIMHCKKEVILNNKTEISTSDYPRETLFEFYQDYTSLDEDYYNEIIIETTGDLLVYQRSTFMYEPTAIEHRKFINEFFANDIKATLEKNKANIDELPNEGWSDDYCPYKIKIRDRKFALRSINSESTTAAILVSVRILIDYYYPELVNWETVFHGNDLVNFYNEIMEIANKLDDSKSQ